LALTLHGPVEPIFPRWLQVIWLFLLWGLTLLMVALLIDSLTVMPPVDIESPPVATARVARHSSVAPAPL
jgi:hypothetical protein